MKKILIFLSTALVLLVLIFAMGLPYFLDLQGTRKRILQTAESSLNGKLELGDLSIRYWPPVSIRINGIKVMDETDHQLLSVENAFVDIPLQYWIGDTPRIIVRLERPQLQILRDEKGALNFGRLIKGDANLSAFLSKGPSNALVLPAIIASSKVSLDLNQAFIHYENLVDHSKQEFSNVRILLQDFSLSRPTAIVMQSDLNARIGGIALKGPFGLTGQITPAFEKQRIAHFSGQIDADFSNVSVIAMDLLEKSPGIHAHVTGRLAFDSRSLKLDPVDLKIKNSSVRISGAITDARPAPRFDLVLKGAGFDLSGLSIGVPLDGSAHIEGSLAGPSDQLSLNIHADVSKVSYHNPALRLHLEDVAGKIEFKDKSLAISSIRMRAWEGSIFGDLKADWSATPVPYDYSISTNRVSLAQASETFSFFKNTMTGNLDLKATGTGKGTTITSASGRFDITDARIMGISISQTLTDGLNQGVSKAAAGIPQLEIPSVKNPMTKPEEYESVASEFSISQDRLTIPRLLARPKKNQGFKIEGSLQAGLENSALKAEFEISDPYDLLRIKRHGLKIDKLPVVLGCTIEKPCFKPERTVAVLSKAIQSNFTKHAKTTLQKRLKDKLKNAPPEVKKLLKKIGL